jgi:hypothetical protein
LFPKDGLDFPGIDAFGFRQHLLRLLLVADLLCIECLFRQGAGRSPTAVWIIAFSH